MPEIEVGYDGALVAHDVVVVVGVQRVGERGLQSGVTLGDVEWVGVVGDVEQLRHLRLAGLAAVVEPEVALLAELVVEVEGRRQVDDVAYGVDVDTAVVLDEVGVLRLDEETDVVVVFLDAVAQVQSDVVCVVLVFRVAAETAVECGGLFQIASNGCRPGVPLAVFRKDAVEGVGVHAAVVVGLAVAFVLTVAQLVAGLQVCALPERFAVGAAHYVAAIVRGRRVVAGGVVGGVETCLILDAEEVDGIVAGILVFAVSAVGFQSYDDVAATGVQTTE